MCYLCYLHEFHQISFKRLGFLFSFITSYFLQNPGSTKRNMYSMYAHFHLIYVEIIRPVKEMLRISDMTGVEMGVKDLGSL